jgi:hypothetical protein
MWSLLSVYWYGEQQTQIRPGPGRNIPDLSEILQQAKIKLKSPEVIDLLQKMNGMPESLLIRSKLRHIQVHPRVTEWPCVNPIFIELRQKFKLKKASRISKGMVRNTIPGSE